MVSLWSLHNQHSIKTLVKHQSKQSTKEMGKIGTRLPGFCLNRIRTHVRVRSPPIQSKPLPSVDVANSNREETERKKSSDSDSKQVAGRKIMIVVDSSIEAKVALQWALTHTVQSQDLVILLHVTKPSKQGTSEESKKDRSRGYEIARSLKIMGQTKRPEIQLEISVVEGKEKGPLIVEEAKKQGVSLLVLGQKRRSLTWRLVMMWATNKVTGGVVEYCIQNAECMAIAVRRKSKKYGGYLITTKRHKDFWLLA